MQFTMFNPNINMYAVVNDTMCTQLLEKAFAKAYGSCMDLEGDILGDALLSQFWLLLKVV